MKLPTLTILLSVAFIFILVNTSALNFHPEDTTKTKKTRWGKSMIAPSVLISTGLFTTTKNNLFNKHDFQAECNEWMPGFISHADDYLQYAPIAVVYGLDVFGVKGKHNIVNQTVLLVKSELILTVMVVSLKKLTAVPRPDSGSPNSFPSGHTAQAFAAATFLHKEYGKYNIKYSVLGYATATSVGLLRVFNNRHWISDVLVGAGIGILSTNLAYLTHQNKWGNKSNRLSKIMIMPSYAQKTVGMFALISIH